MRTTTRVLFMASATALVLSSGGARGASPLPGVSIAGSRPVVWFVLDNSGSMDACDGGLFDESDISNIPVMALLNPRTTYEGSTSSSPTFYTNGDLKRCSTHASFGTGTWDHDSNAGTPAVPQRNNAAGPRIYMLSRVEAVKVALARLLDVNDNGVIDATDDAEGGYIAGASSYCYPNTGVGGVCADSFNVYDTNRTATMLVPVGKKSGGSNLKAIWDAVLIFHTARSGTPHGPALAGARALGLAKCWDSDGATVYNGVTGGCELGAGEQAANGNDLSLACRKYYILHLTDGEPSDFSPTADAVLDNANGDGISDNVPDGVAISKKLWGRDVNGDGDYVDAGEVAPQLAYPTESGAHLVNKAVYTVGVGFGLTVVGANTRGRGAVNCQSYWSDIDANGDAEAPPNPLTMDTDTTADMTSTAATCNNFANYDSSGELPRYYGNGFLAADAASLASQLTGLFAAITTGTFAGAEPTFTVNAGGVAAGNSVYSASFDVITAQVERYGHLRKYRFDTTGLGFVNCDTGSGPGTMPCWDAGGVMVVSSGGFAVRNEVALGDSNDGTYSTPGAQPMDFLGGLAERNWLTRRVFAPNPAAMTGTNYEDDESADATRRPDAGGSARTVANMIPSLSPLPVSPTPTDLTSLLSGAALTNLQTWLAWGSTEAAIAGYVDTVDTYDAASYGSIPVGVVQSSGAAYMMLAGRPTATFSDGTKRCGTCSTDDAFSPKFGYPNHSRPVVVGPPAGYTTNVTYTGISGVDDSGFLETVLTNPYAGSEAVIERDEAYSYGGSYNPAAEVVANPCGEGFSGTCKVKLRRKVVYIGGNDGAVHAFDDKTGHELWAFVPPGMLRKVMNMRAGAGVTLLDGSATVRDVLFSTVGGERTGDGLWHTVMVYSVGLGGRFYFALDVTNPVDPKFLWEFHDSELGNTVARAAIAEIRDHGALDNNDPGTDIIATSGALPSGETRARTLYTINPRIGTKLDEVAIPVADLATGETAVDVANALTGEPRAVDVDFDGKTDRVYFGDLEGRMWKACDFAEHGQIGAVKLFFDPALYDNPNANSPGYPDTPGADGGDATPLGGAAAADALQRQQLRGPIYFPADVTHDGAGGLLVAFGSGNIMDVLTPPAAYKNMLWVVKDDILAASCAPPMASSCAGNTGLNTVTIATPAARTFDNVLLIDELLTGAPQILSGFLVYPEFKRTTSSTCTGSSYLSRVNARDVFNCGTPASTAFSDPVTNTPNVITYADTLVTGLQVDPTSGTLFIQNSTGTAPPNAVNAPGLQSQTVTVGFRQIY